MIVGRKLLVMLEGHDLKLRACRNKELEAFMTGVIAVKLSSVK